MDGISALKAVNTSTAGGLCVDFAGVSRGPRSTDIDANGNPLAFIPFAADELRYATSNPTPSFPSAPVTNAPQDLTAAQLVAIYECTATTWSDVGGASTDTIEPLLPQFGSGGRTYFESVLGITDAQVGSCVSTVGENDPSVIRADADRIAPFSVAAYNTRNQDAGIQLNVAGFDAARPLYHVVNLDPVTGGMPVYLQSLLGDGTAGSGWVCGTVAQQVVNAAGFTSLPAECGSAVLAQG